MMSTYQHSPTGRRTLRPAAGPSGVDVVVYDVTPKPGPYFTQAGTDRYLGAW